MCFADVDICLEHPCRILSDMSNIYHNCITSQKKIAQHVLHFCNIIPVIYLLKQMKKDCFLYFLVDLCVLF